MTYIPILISLVLASASLHAKAQVIQPTFNTTTWTKPYQYLLQCLSNSTSPFITLTDPQWPTYATTFNERLQYMPAAITIPNTTEQITAAVSCASNMAFLSKPSREGIPTHHIAPAATTGS